MTGALFLVLQACGPASPALLPLSGLERRAARYPEPIDPALVLTPVWEPGASRFGRVILGLGDVDGDGFDDIAVANNRPYLPGNVFVYLGSPDGIQRDSEVVLEVDHFVWPYAVGDVDGDGFADLLLHPDADRDHFLYWGGPDGIHQSRRQLVHLDGACLTGQLRPAGDLWGVGRNALAALGCTPFETVHVWSMGADRSLSTAPYAIAESTSSDYGFGWVTPSGDIDGDGHDDLSLLTVTKAESFERLALHIVHGSAGGVEPTARPPLEGPSLFPYEAPVSAGDVNGDGFSDVVIRSPQANDRNGAVLVLFGSSTGLDPRELVLTGVRTPALFTHGAIGDINSDGYDDLLTGSGSDGSFYTSPSVVLGGPGGPDPCSETLLADVAVTRGAPAGDVNGDGFADWMVAGSTDGLDLVTLFHGRPDFDWTPCPVAWPPPDTGDTGVTPETADTAAELVPAREPSPAGGCGCDQRARRPAAGPWQLLSRRRMASGGTHAHAL